MSTTAPIFGGGAWGIAFMVWLGPQVLQRFFSELLTPFA